MYCSKCGTKLPDDAVFCSECGASAPKVVAASTSVPAAPPTPTPTEVPAAPPTPTEVPAAPPTPTEVPAAPPTPTPTEAPVTPPAPTEAAATSPVVAPAPQHAPLHAPVSAPPKKKSKLIPIVIIAAAAVVLVLVVTGLFLASNLLGGSDEGNKGSVTDKKDDTEALADDTSIDGLIITDDIVGTGAKAQNGDTLLVHYTGYLEDGEVFGSSIERNEPFEFEAGSGAVIDGWEKGILDMRVGGRRTLVISPELAYGKEGRGMIPPNATLVFEVELLAVNGDYTGGSMEDEQDDDTTDASGGSKDSEADTSDNRDWPSWKGLPITINAYDGTYVISSFVIEEDPDTGNTVIACKGSGFDVMSLRNGSFVIPVYCAVIVNGEEILPDTYSSGANGCEFLFDRKLSPETVVFYSGETGEGRVEVKVK